MIDDLACQKFGILFKPPMGYSRWTSNDNFEYPAWKREQDIITIYRVEEQIGVGEDFKQIPEVDDFYTSIPKIACIKDKQYESMGQRTGVLLLQLMSMREALINNLESGLKLIDEVIENVNTVVNDEDALRIIEMMFKRPGFDFALLPIADIMKKIFQFERAFKLYQCVFEQYRKRATFKKQLDILREMAIMKLMQKDITGALQVFEIEVNVCTSEGYYDDVRRAYRGSAGILDIFGYHNESIHMMKLSVEIALKHKQKNFVKWCTQSVQNIEIRKKILNKAREWQLRTQTTDVLIMTQSSKKSTPLEFPLDPKINQLDDLILRIYGFLTNRPSKIRYYFQGIDKNGQVVIDNNNRFNYFYKDE
ncbi:MAG: hypothetical protein ACFFAS_02830 [Promethearchaeota archaeon]